MQAAVRVDERTQRLQCIVTDNRICCEDESEQYAQKEIVKLPMTDPKFAPAPEHRRTADP